MRVALLVNPDSGSGDAESVTAELRSHGVEVDQFGIDDGDGAATSGAERVVVAGGDGSIGCAAASAARAGVPLAVVPVGTANDFARTLDLPRDFRAAAALAARGEGMRALDLAWLEADGARRPFLNAASVGLSPVAARRAQPFKRLLGPLSYAVGAIRAGFGAQPVAARVACDGETLFAGDAWQVSVASTGAFGGGAEVEADPRDGRLDVVVIEAESRLRLVRHAYGLRAGRLEDQPGVRRARGRSIEVMSDGRTGFNVDGELIDLASARFTVEPGSVEVVVS